MIVQASINVYLDISEVDDAKSIPAAVADRLGVDESQLSDPDDWTWVYESQREYTWDDQRRANGIDPFTGDPFEDEDVAS